jgi:heptosyltransferase-1
MSVIQRVLIVKVSAMGDIIHALPVCSALKEAYPHLEISWAVEEAFVPLLEGNSCLSSLVVLPKIRGTDLRHPSFYKMYFDKVRAACAKGIDLSLDLQGLTKSAVIAFKSGARIRLGYHWLREGARLLEKPVARRPESVHIVDQYLDVADALGASTIHVQFPFFISDSDDIAVKELLAQHGVNPGAPYVCVNPASARTIKQWSPERFGLFMDRMYCESGIPCVLVTADERVAAAAARSAGRPVANLAGKTTLKQLAAVLKRCAVHVCGDTGSGHLAAALGRPVVSLIGPTDPDRACPYGQRENVISEHKVCGVQCDGRNCQFDRPRCMEAIQVDAVTDKVFGIVSWK